MTQISSREPDDPGQVVKNLGHQKFRALIRVRHSLHNCLFYVYKPRDGIEACLALFAEALLHQESELEERYYDLVLRDAAAATTLAMVAGTSDRKSFYDAEAKCRSLRDEVQLLSGQIAAHREEHGC